VTHLVVPEWSQNIPQESKPSFFTTSEILALQVELGHFKNVGPRNINASKMQWVNLITILVPTFKFWENQPTDTLLPESKSLKSKSKLMCNREMGSDTTGSKCGVKLNWPQEIEESVFGCPECLLEDVIWCLKNFSYLILFSNGKLRVTFEVLVNDNQIEQLRYIG
jgi:hypothetical protein